MDDSLKEAIDKAREAIVDLPLEARHCAVLATEMLEMSINYMLARAQREGEGGFVEGGFDVMSAMASTIASVAMTMTQGDRERAPAVVKGFIKVLDKGATKIVTDQATNLINVASD